MQIPIQVLHDAFNEARKASEEGKMPHFVEFTEESGRVAYSFSQ